jgi:RND superfamily putative drug exporter
MLVTPSQTHADDGGDQGKKMLVEQTGGGGLNRQKIAQIANSCVDALGVSGMSSNRMDNVGKLAWIPSGRKSKWAVVIFWFLVAGIALGPSGMLTDAQKNDAVAWLPGGAESTKVIAAQAKFPSNSDVPAVVVYERGGVATPADQAAVAAQVTKFNALKSVQSASIGPIPSKDKHALQVIVPINPESPGFDSMGAAIDQLSAIGKASPAGLSVNVTGPAGLSADQAKSFAGIDGKLLYSALAVVIFILLITYRSPVLWLLPVISAGFGLIIAQAVVYLLADKAGLTVNAQSAGILTVLVFGAGTDYALLLVARYREELRNHEDRHEAMAFALHRTGPAIFASGTTVIAGMLCLLFASMNSTKGLGPVAAVGIAVALLVMLTLLPALLVIFGRWFFWPVKLRFGSTEKTGNGFWAKVGSRVAEAPRAVWVGTSFVLVLGALGVGQLNAVGLQNKDMYIDTPASIVGEQIMTKHFPAGAGDPVVVIAKADHAAAVGKAMSGVNGISEVAPPIVKGDLAYLAGTMSYRTDSTDAIGTVDGVRAAVHKVEGADAIAGGSTATRVDTLRASSRDNKIVMPLILAVVFLILMLLLRSVVAPVILAATVVLSYGAALGISALVFRKVFNFAGADPSLPLLTFVFLVALGIDYNIFLMTRVHEESKQFGTRRGALTGLSSTGGVITSAGLVLAGTFAVLATLPMVTFAEMGFTVAVGVLLDTLVVRSVLVTALNLDVGQRMWWPSKLGEETDPEEAELADMSGVAEQIIAKEALAAEKALL